MSITRELQVEMPEFEEMCAEDYSERGPGVYPINGSGSSVVLNNRITKAEDPTRIIQQLIKAPAIVGDGVMYPGVYYDQSQNSAISHGRFFSLQRAHF